MAVLAPHQGVPDIFGACTRHHRSASQIFKRSVECYCRQCKASKRLPVVAGLAIRSLHYGQKILHRREDPVTSSWCNWFTGAAATNTTGRNKIRVWTINNIHSPCSAIRDVCASASGRVDQRLYSGSHRSTTFALTLRYESTIAGRGPLWRSIVLLRTRDRRWRRRRRVAL